MRLLAVILLIGFGSLLNAEVSDLSQDQYVQRFLTMNSNMKLIRLNTFSVVYNSVNYRPVLTNIRKDEIVDASRAFLVPIGSSEVEGVFLGESVWGQNNTALIKSSSGQFISGKVVCLATTDTFYLSSQIFPFQEILFTQKFVVQDHNFREIRQPFYFIGLASKANSTFQIFDAIESHQVTGTIAKNTNIDVLGYAVGSETQDHQEGSQNWFLVRGSSGIIGWTYLVLIPGTDEDRPTFRLGSIDLFSAVYN